MSKLEELKTERESIIKEIKKIRFEQSVDIKMRMNELERKMGELSRQIKIENEILLRQIRREEYDKKFEKRIDMDISGTAKILEERKKKQENTSLQYKFHESISSLMDKASNTYHTRFTFSHTVADHSALVGIVSLGGAGSIFGGRAPAFS